jgi:hypothetical protein
MPWRTWAFSREGSPPLHYMGAVRCGTQCNSLITSQARRGAARCKAQGPPHDCETGAEVGVGGSRSHVCKFALTSRPRGSRLTRLHSCYGCVRFVRKCGASCDAARCAIQPIAKSSIQCADLIAFPCQRHRAGSRGEAQARPGEMQPGRWVLLESQNTRPPPPPGGDFSDRLKFHVPPPHCGAVWKVGPWSCAGGLPAAAGGGWSIFQAQGLVVLSGGHAIACAVL